MVIHTSFCQVAAEAYQFFSFWCSHRAITHRSSPQWQQFLLPFSRYRNSSQWTVANDHVISWTDQPIRCTVWSDSATLPKLCTTWLWKQKFLLKAWWSNQCYSTKQFCTILKMPVTQVLDRWQVTPWWQTRKWLTKLATHKALLTSGQHSDVLVFLHLRFRATHNVVIVNHQVRKLQGEKCSSSTSVPLVHIQW